MKRAISHLVLGIYFASVAGCQGRHFNTSDVERDVDPFGKLGTLTVIVPPNTQSKQFHLPDTIRIDGVIEFSPYALSQWKQELGVRQSFQLNPGEHCVSVAYKKHVDNPSSFEDCSISVKAGEVTEYHLGFIEGNLRLEPPSLPQTMHLKLDEKLVLSPGVAFLLPAGQYSYSIELGAMVSIHNVADGSYIMTVEKPLPPNCQIYQDLRHDFSLAKAQIYREEWQVPDRRHTFTYSQPADGPARFLVAAGLDLNLMASVYGQSGGRTLILSDDAPLSVSFFPTRCTRFRAEGDIPGSFVQTLGESKQFKVDTRVINVNEFQDDGTPGFVDVDNNVGKKLVNKVQAPFSLRVVDHKSYHFRYYRKDSAQKYVLVGEYVLDLP